MNQIYWNCFIWMKEDGIMIVETYAGRKILSSKDSDCECQTSIQFHLGWSVHLRDRAEHSLPFSYLFMSLHSFCDWRYHLNHLIHHDHISWHSIPFSACLSLLSLYPRVLVNEWMRPLICGRKGQARLAARERERKGEPAVRFFKRWSYERIEPFEVKWSYKGIFWIPFFVNRIHVQKDSVKKASKEFSSMAFLSNGEKSIWIGWFWWDFLFLKSCLTSSVASFLLFSHSLPSFFSLILFLPSFLSSPILSFLSILGCVYQSAWTFWSRPSEAWSFFLCGRRNLSKKFH